MQALKTSLALLFCIAIFSNCSKKTTQEFTPTETFHPPKTTTMVSKNPPSVEEGTFWIGSSTEHSFSVDAGSISMSGVYALVNKDQLDKDAMGNLIFYPKKSLADIEFFKSEIGNLDYVEGYFYYVEGSKHYLGTKLWGVIVNKVLQKVKDRSQMSGDNRVTQMGTQPNGVYEIDPTETFHPPVANKENSQPRAMVSENPPTVLESVFWIGSSRNHSFSVATGSINVQGAYAINNIPVLNKDASGNLMFYPKESLTELEFFDSKIGNMDYKEGYYYQVQGSKQYLKNRLAGIYVSKVLQKVKDNAYHRKNNNAVATNTQVTQKPFTPAEATHPTSVKSDDKKPRAMVSENPPTVLESVFWIGSSRNHSFSVATGSINIQGAYAINNIPVLNKDASGNLMFYPKESLTELEFFDSKIGNMDYKEGYYYQVQGSKQYLKNRLAGIYVSKVLQKVKDNNFKPQDKGMASAKSGVEINSTNAKISARTDESDQDNKEGVSMVSPDPPSYNVGQFWIGSSKNHTFSVEAGVISVEGAYAISMQDELSKFPDGSINFYPTKSLSELEFFHSDIDNFDYEEGYFYKIDGSLYYLGDKLSGVRVVRVLEKIKDEKYSNTQNEEPVTFTPTVATHPYPRNPKPNNDEEVISMVSSDPPSIFEGTFWIGSSKNVSHSTPKGDLNVENCYVVNKNAEIMRDPVGGLAFLPYDSVDDLDYLCGDINGLDYEEGYYYQVKGSMGYGGNTLKSITVNQVLEKVEDLDYEKVEERIIFIGPETSKGVGLHGNELDCFQVQYDKYSRSAEWEGHCGWIGGFDYEPGYMYKLKIKRSYMSKRENSMTADAEPYKDQLIAILRIRRM